MTNGGYVKIFGDASGMADLNFGWIPSENEGGTFLPCQDRTTPYTDASVFNGNQWFSFNVWADVGEAMTLFYQSYLKPAFVRAEGLARETPQTGCNPSIDRFSKGKAIAPLPQTKGKP